jgi:hypothetical protein
VNLPAVATQLQVARSLNASIDANAIKDIKAKLSTSSEQSVPAYWEAVGQLVSYGSAFVVGDKVAQRTVNNLKTCELPMRIRGLTIDLEFLCTLPLDGLRLENATIKNCIVIYRGGPTTLRNVDFKNCYFITEVQAKPGRIGQMVMSSLLASDGSNVLLNAG